MAYAKPLEQRLQRGNNLETIFNEFLEKIFPTERVAEDEARELKERLDEILTARETPIDWREIEKDALE